MLFRKQRRRISSSRLSKLSFEALESRQLLTGLDGSEVIGLPSDMIANAYVFIGDHSGSNSEKWNMAVGGRTHSAPDFGEVQRDYRQFKKGESYPVSIQHAGSIYPTGEEDFDYRAWVDRYANPTWTSGNPVPSGHEFFVTDTQQLFQRQYFSDTAGSNPTIGKSAAIHFPAIDLDIDSDSSGSLERSVSEDNLETVSTQGLKNPVTNGDIDNDGIVDRLDFNGISGFSFARVVLSLSSNISLVASSGYGSSVNLTFNFNDSGAGTGGLFRLWKRDASVSRSLTDLVAAGSSISASSLGLEPGGSISLFLESVNPTNKTVHFDPISVTASIAGNIWNGVISDSVYAKGINFKGQLDLDVDSNNDGQITESDDSGETSQNAAKVRINTDDDDKNSVVDKNQNGIAGEDDLGKLNVKWKQDNASNFANHTLSLHWGNANSQALAKVWSDATKTGSEVTLNSDLTSFANTRTWQLGNNNIDQTFFVEGLQANGAAEFVLKVWDAAGKAIQSDKVNMTIIGERIIWLTGYWNPANTSGILADFATAVEGFENSGFTVKAYDYLVNYDEVSQKFWSTAATERPIAILSFGLDKNLQNQWHMEPDARNLARSQWGQDTYDASGNRLGDPGYDPTTAIDTGLPAIGGANDDRSPFGNSGSISSFNNLSSSVAGRVAGTYSNVPATSLGVGTGASFNVVVDQSGTATVQLAGNNSGNGYKVGDVVTISDANLGAGGAPDVALSISGIAPIQNGDAIDSTYGLGLPRTSNLPFTEITLTDGTIIQGQQNSCGEFLCEYMAYTVSWYRKWTETNANLDRFQKTAISGFTHVDEGKSAANGKGSVKTMLREVIKKLEPNY